MADITIVTVMGFINHLITGGHHPVDRYIYIYIYINISINININADYSGSRMQQFAVHSPLSQSFSAWWLSHPSE